MRLEEAHWLEVLWPLLLYFLPNFQIDGLTDSKKLSEKNVKIYMLKLQKSVTGLQLNQTALR